jgi:hypothetical protein
MMSQVTEACTTTLVGRIMYYTADVEKAERHLKLAIYFDASFAHLTYTLVDFTYEWVGMRGVVNP